MPEPVRQSLLAVVLVTAAVGALAASSTPRAAGDRKTDIYRFAGECVTLRDTWTNRRVVRDAFGYTLLAPAGAATPFRMQATALGSYLLYGPDARMPAATWALTIGPAATADATADWKVTDEGAALQLTNVSTGQRLSVGWAGRLVQTDRDHARWQFERADGCASFPEIPVDVDGTPPALTGGARLRGFIDTHVHPTAFEFLGGLFHCGRPWSPYGATQALRDCPDHGEDGRFALAENLLSTGNLFGTHSSKGWPDFDGWPRYSSLTHENTYWRSIERAWRGGLRIMVADLVENRALCELYWLKKNPCGDMDSIRLQARDLYALQDYVDAQFKGPGRGFFRIVKSPQEARAAIARGQLAVVMGVETSQIFDCLIRDDAAPCTESQVDRGLQELWDLGVRSFFPVHKFDNAFGGTMMDAGATGLLVNLGNAYMTGRWWEVGPCPGPDGDNDPYGVGAQAPASFSELAQLPADRAVFGTELPLPPAASPAGVQAVMAPVCNTRGLTSLGAYLINRMIDRGFIIETDHMGVRTRAQALSILEARGYSGVITSHSWEDVTSRGRIQALGGFVGPYASTTNDFITEWQNARATRSDSFAWGLGFGSDTNGIGAQPAARVGAILDDPVTYPFPSVDGSVTIRQNRWNSRLWDVNVTGVDHYGLFVDWIEDLRHIGGPEIIDDLSGGAEAYIQMWERAVGDASGTSPRSTAREPR